MGCEAGFFVVAGAKMKSRLAELADEDIRQRQRAVEALGGELALVVGGFLAVADEDEGFDSSRRRRSGGADGAAGCGALPTWRSARDGQRENEQAPRASVAMPGTGHRDREASSRMAREEGRFHSERNMQRPAAEASLNRSSSLRLARPRRSPASAARRWSRAFLAKRAFQAKGIRLAAPRAAVASWINKPGLPSLSALSASWSGNSISRRNICPAPVPGGRRGARLTRAGRAAADTSQQGRGRRGPEGGRRPPPRPPRRRRSISRLSPPPQIVAALYQPGRRHRRGHPARQAAPRGKRRGHQAQPRRADRHRRDQRAARREHAPAVHDPPRGQHRRLRTHGAGRPQDRQGIHARLSGRPEANPRHPSEDHLHQHRRAAVQERRVSIIYAGSAAPDPPPRPARNTPASTG